jgi:transposase
MTVQAPLANAAFGQLYRLTVQFTEMLCNREPEQLRPWLEAAQASELAELKSLASGMERDYAEVEAALPLDYSTEPVEGNINRLKLIKRSGYGRSGFDLLRLRVLPHFVWSRFQVRHTAAVGQNGKYGFSVLTTENEDESR